MSGPAAIGDVLSLVGIPLSVWLCALGGFAALCLATDRHGARATDVDDRWSRLPPPAFQAWGFAALLLALLRGVAHSGALMGAVEAFFAAFVGALLTAGLAGRAASARGRRSLIAVAVVASFAGAAMALVELS